MMQKELEDILNKLSPEEQTTLLNGLKNEISEKVSDFLYELRGAISQLQDENSEIINKYNYVASSEFNYEGDSGFESSVDIDYIDDRIGAALNKIDDTFRRSDIETNTSDEVERILNSDSYSSVCKDMTQEQINKEVKEAFEKTTELKMGERTYQDVLLEQRIEGPTNAGSSYEMTKDELKEAILNANWTKTEHPEVAKGCTVYVTDDLPVGRNGIVDIKHLPEGTDFYAIDPKNTGNISIGAAGVPKKPELETYLIIGKEVIDGKPEDVVFTFHPGEPVSPSIISTEEISDGTRLTKQEVLSLGFEKAKYMSPDMVKNYEAIAVDYNSKGDIMKDFFARNPDLHSNADKNNVMKKSQDEILKDDKEEIEER